MSSDEPYTMSLLQEMYGSHTVLIPKVRPSVPGDYARSLLGQQVRVVLDRTSDNPWIPDWENIPGSGPPHEDVVTEGVLLGFGDGGDFEILEDDGLIHYCWPMLKVEPR
jgi:hypothetical protein